MKSTYIIIAHSVLILISLFTQILAVPTRSGEGSDQHNQLAQSDSLHENPPDPLREIASHYLTIDDSGQLSAGQYFDPIAARRAARMLNSVNARRPTPRPTPIEISNMRGEYQHLPYDAGERIARQDSLAMVDRQIRLRRQIYECYRRRTEHVMLDAERRTRPRLSLESRDHRRHFLTRGASSSRSTEAQEVASFSEVRNHEAQSGAVSETAHEATSESSQHAQEIATVQRGLREQSDASMSSSSQRPTKLRRYD